MKTVVCLWAILTIAVPFASAAERGNSEAAEPPTPAVAGHDGFLLTSGVANGLAARETTGPDTFVLYGGPDHPTEGKFELANGVTADWGSGNGLPGNYGGGPGAWTPVDHTKLPVYWHRDTFNAETLNNNGTGNHAMWCGVDVGDPLGSDWVHVPGYGNSWSEALLYESAPIADTSAGQTVALDLFFHHDTEPGWDFFSVQYDSAGTWTSVLSLDGSDKDTSNTFNAPGIQFSTVATGPIEYSGNDYSGDNSDQIRIRLIVSADGAWSDQDGLWITDAGAAQVDDITLTTSQGTFTEDYESVLVPPDKYLFHPAQTPFAGDFADVYPRFTDIDPCRDNETPVAGFIDYGQIVRNGPASDGYASTGGTPMEDFSYGIPGNWAVNYSGGLSRRELKLYNSIHSPDIPLDVDGVADDDPAFSGEFFRFDVWAHLAINHGIVYVWSVRSAMPGESYGDWVDRNLVYYHSGMTEWIEVRHDVSDLIPPGAERMQVSLAVLDYGCEFCPGGSTPAPIFDNVAVYKYRLPGPTLSTRTIDLAQDGFPINGSIDVSTPAARDALDIPFSMARDVNTGDTNNVPGDSITVDVTSFIGDATVTDIRMLWVLDTSPLFEDALRTAPARSVDQNVITGPAGTVWSGEVVASASMTTQGVQIEDRWFFDLPDVDLMYPGDVLHYYVQATDSDGRISTMPHDTSGFDVFGPDSPYDRNFTVRGLPTLTDTAGAQPEILVINDFGRRGVEVEFTTAFRNLGYLEGVHYDTYTVQGPTSGVSNGIGATGGHGATGVQLAGYDHMFYFGGNLINYLLSDGSNIGYNDKGDDIGALEDWHALAGTRDIVYFGDYIGTALVDASTEGAAYLANTMGVEYVDQDVSDAIGGQLTPVITPSPYGATWFATNYVANGGCLTINEFDQIRPLPGAEAGHYFTSADGTPITDASAGVASVIHPTANGVDITFPYSIMFIQNVLARDVGVSSRTQLFAEILGLFSAAPGGAPVAAPVALPVALSAFPNPFNPVTVVKFTAQLGAKGSVKVFNLRGELVRTLHSGEFATQEFRWDGVDERGASVASGVYVIKAETEGNTQTKKVALVK